MKAIPKAIKAFTLIELMAVMMVIAILVGITLPRIRGIQEEALITKAKGELRTIQIAIESFYVHSGPPNYYPADSFTIIDDTLLGVEPQVIKEVIYDPFYYEDDQEYGYYKAESGPYYVIFSVGPNGEADVTGINDDGILTGAEGDDIFVTNGSGEFGE